MIDIDYNRYALGSYYDEEEAAIAFATAKYHFVTKLKLTAKRTEVEAKIVASDAIAASMKVDPKQRYKFDNTEFFEDGRTHHDTSIDPPLLIDESFYTQDECNGWFGEMNAAIEASRSEAKERLYEKIKNKDLSVSCADVLVDSNSAIRQFFEKGSYRSEEDMNAAVVAVVGDMGKSLRDFVSVPLKKREEYQKKEDYSGYLRKVCRLVRGNMVLFLGKHCYYCGRCINPDHPKKWYAYHLEHPGNLGEKDSKALHNREMMELRKCVPVCAPCNPTDNDRSFPIDLGYEKRILVPDSDLDSGKYPHTHIDDILDSTAFKSFYEEAEGMGLEYSKKVNENGVSLTNSSRGRCATFLELKLLVWKYFQILLDDIVTWRKISDYESPRVAFHSTVATLIKVLTNQCPGTEEGGRPCTGWRNLRNMCPYQYKGVHYDHNGGAGRGSKQRAPNGQKLCVNDYYGSSWERFIEEIRKCIVLCAECHMGN